MAEQKEIAIAVKDLHKSFKLPHEQHSGIKQAILNFFKRNRKKGYETQNVLKGLDFEIEKGEFFGIVGRNGSGKSTLLKTLAGIYSPDKGAVEVNGTLVPFIELGVGFNPELTGRENVFLNGALLGFSRDEMEAMYDDIVEFAELEKFMDQKLKNYSSGMQVRLAFSIAIRADADILVLDEVLAVGDEAFQRKCYSYFAQLKRENKTVILVTHSMDAVQQFCTKAALIDKGHELTIGTPLEIAQIYRELNSEREVKAQKKKDEYENKYFKCSVKQSKETKSLRFTTLIEPMSVLRKSDIVFTFAISKESGEIVYRFTSEDMTEQIDLTKSNKIELNIDNIFPDGSYAIHVAVKKKDRSKNYALFDNIHTFSLSKGVGYQFWRPEESYSISTY